MLDGIAMDHKDHRMLYMSTDLGDKSSKLRCWATPMLRFLPSNFHASEHPVMSVAPGPRGWFARSRYPLAHRSYVK